MADAGELAGQGSPKCSMLPVASLGEPEVRVQTCQHLQSEVVHGIWVQVDLAEAAEPVGMLGAQENAQGSRMRSGGLQHRGVYPSCVLAEGLEVALSLSPRCSED